MPRSPRWDVHDDYDPRNWDGPQLLEDILRWEAEKRGAVSSFRVRQVALEQLDALRKGAILDDGVPMLDVAGKCHLPREIERPLGPMGKIVYIVPCRSHCTWCLKMRGKQWAIRAQSEIRLSARTWFGTLTLSDQNHYAMLCRADGGGAFGVSVKRGKPVEKKFADLTPGEQFGVRLSAISPELTKWLKRVRKRSGAPLRFLLVVEAHKSGLPHFHVLVHQLRADTPVTWRDLHDEWTLGFSKFNLVRADEFNRADDPSVWQQPSRTAWYVCKYLTKACLARVRASKRYGLGDLEAIAKA